MHTAHCSISACRQWTMALLCPIFQFLLYLCQKALNCILCLELNSKETAEEDSVRWGNERLLEFYCWCNFAAGRRINWGITTSQWRHSWASAIHRLTMDWMYESHFAALYASCRVLTVIWADLSSHVCRLFFFFSLSAKAVSAVLPHINSRGKHEYEYFPRCTPIRKSER